MAYGDPQNYCEIFETCTDFTGREIERVVSRWRAPGGLEPSLPALERQAEKLGRSLGKNLQCRVIER